MFDERVDSSEACLNTICQLTASAEVSPSIIHAKGRLFTGFDLVEGGGTPRRGTPLQISLKLRLIDFFTYYVLCASLHKT